MDIEILLIDLDATISSCHHLHRDNTNSCFLEAVQRGIKVCRIQLEGVTSCSDREVVRNLNHVELLLDHEVRDGSRPMTAQAAEADLPGLLRGALQFEHVAIDLAGAVFLAEIPDVDVVGSQCFEAVIKIERDLPCIISVGARAEDYLVALPRSAAPRARSAFPLW
jgi:hypothetical protein